MLGPNAAGKTTTRKLLVGLMKPTAGQARIAGFDVQTHPFEALWHGTTQWGSFGTYVAQAAALRKRRVV